MYLVPMELPKYCNECPFGRCSYNYPLWDGGRKEPSISCVDNGENTAGTYGYTCNVEFQINNRYTKVLRANIGEDIKKPDWCELKEVNENADSAY